MFRKKPLRINSYISYGTETRLRATGRALEDENIKFENNISLFRTLKNIYRQFESDEIPNAHIELQLADGQFFSTTTNSEGYFYFDEAIKNGRNLINELGWLPYTLSFKNIEYNKITNANAFKGIMLIPSPDAAYGVISDIDDTIIHTGVTSFFKWRVITNTLLKNFDKRLPLEGTSELYKKLQLGKKKSPLNPIFYVSNSPWNLFDYLSSFLNAHHFPKGPVLLRDIRMPYDRTPKSKTPHKELEIITILEIYPHLKFILIGDCGEKDIDIYTKIARKHPERIIAIYMRSVNHRRKEKRIQTVIDNFKNTPAFLIYKSDEAITHAKNLGIID